MCGVALACGLSLPMAAPALAQAPMTDGWPIAAADGRPVVVLPTAEARFDARLDAGAFAAQTTETASRREHTVSFGGETFRAWTPLDGPGSRVAFDPARRAFVELLPSLRIELAPGVRLDGIAEALGATRIVRFEALGFAIVELPADLHPGDAVARLRQLPVPPGAAVRLRAPELKWR